MKFDDPHRWLRCPLDRRPQLDRLVDQLRPGDTIVVWRLDRLGRSLKHLIQLIEDLAEKEVGFSSLTEGLDTTTSGGKLVLQIFGALAEFERSLVRRRTMAGLAPPAQEVELAVGRP